MENYSLNVFQVKLHVQIGLETDYFLCMCLLTMITIIKFLSNKHYMHGISLIDSFSRSNQTLENYLKQENIFRMYNLLAIIMAL